MDLSPENIEHLGRGVLWFIGTATGAYWCYTEHTKSSRPLLVFLFFVLLFGAIFNVFVTIEALQDIF